MKRLTMGLRSLSAYLAAPLSAPLSAPLTALLAATALLGCASPLPAPLLYQLRSEPPVAVPAVAVVANSTANAHAPAFTLQLLQPVALPELLDRDAVVVPRGQAGVQALQGHRWAEPLRDAVPRLLRQDLGLLLGAGRLWVAPLPAGLAVQRQLRVELLALQADAARSQVQLQGRWTLSDPSGRLPPISQVEMITAPVQPGGDVDALVVAHRLVLWRFAERLAERLAGPMPARVDSGPAPQR